MTSLRLVGALLMLALTRPAGGDAQQAEPPDTYADADARALVDKARAARHRDVEGIESYEGVLRQRIYVGLAALRWRRERGLFEHERVARIRWSSDGDRVIQWRGVRTAIPIAGIDSGRPDGPDAALSVSDSAATLRAGEELGEEVAGGLLDETDMPAFEFDPGGERLRFGGPDWALHPLSDTAAAHYQYESGDTLTLSFATDQPDIVLHEVLVRPRRADFRLVAGSLWFDSESGSLVRATYRPARPFDLELDEPDDAAEVPGFLKPITAEISYMTIDYSLQELRYWLPRRFAFEGEARIRRFVRIPITLEWSVGEYRVNETETDLLVDGELPDGWRRQVNVEEEDDGSETHVTVIVPTNEELRTSPELSVDFGERTPTSFTQTETDELAAELQGLLPTYRRFRPQVALGLQQSLVRYNRVEGFSFGTRVTVNLTPLWDIAGEARYGLGDKKPSVEGVLRWGQETNRWTLTGLHRLKPWTEDVDPFNTPSTLNNLVLGGDRAEYYRATGGSVGYQWIGDRGSVSVEAFHERQRPVSLGASFSIKGELSDSTAPAPVRAADPVDLTGARVSFGWFRGIDPNGLILSGRSKVEVGRGGAWYQRASTSASARHPLVFGTAGAVEVEVGSTWGAPPVQRLFLLGGSQTLRGFNRNQLLDESYWRARGELASGFAAARLALFGDVAWVGKRGSFSLGDPFASIGLGVSLLDGIVRADVAKGILRGSSWKVHLYLDGLF